MGSFVLMAGRDGDRIEPRWYPATLPPSYRFHPSCLVIKFSSVPAWVNERGGRDVTTLQYRLTRTGNRIGVWMYRTLNGRLSSGSKHVHVLLITTAGRRTGIPRSTCVRYLETSEGFVVWGTGSGSQHDPDWFRNLRKAEYAELQVRDEQIRARPRELLGTERDAMWNHLILTEAPEVEKYARRAGRMIPVAVLAPTDHRPTT